MQPDTEAGTGVCPSVWARRRLEAVLLLLLGGPLRTEHLLAHGIDPYTWRIRHGTQGQAAALGLLAATWLLRQMGQFEQPGVELLPGDVAALLEVLDQQAQQLDGADGLRTRLRPACLGSLLPDQGVVDPTGCRDPLALVREIGQQLFVSNGRGV